MLIAFSLLPQWLPLSHFERTHPFPHHFETASLFFLIFAQLVSEVTLSRKRTLHNQLSNASIPSSVMVFYTTFPFYDRVLELEQILGTLSEFICAIAPQVSENTASLMLLTPSVSYHLYILSSSKICEPFGGGIWYKYLI